MVQHGRRLKLTRCAAWRRATRARSCRRPRPGRASRPVRRAHLERAQEGAPYAPSGRGRRQAVAAAPAILPASTASMRSAPCQRVARNAAMNASPQPTVVPRMGIALTGMTYSSCPFRLSRPSRTRTPCEPSSPQHVPGPGPASPDRARCGAGRPRRHEVPVRARRRGFRRGLRSQGPDRSDPQADRHAGPGGEPVRQLPCPARRPDAPAPLAGGVGQRGPHRGVPRGP